MTRILMENVHIRYPVLQDHYMSIRRAALRVATGGKLYGQDSETKVVHALKGISLEMNEGDRVALIGRNGAGKSTFLKTLGGFILPDSGSLTINGRVTSLFSVNGGLDIDRTGYDNIFFMGRLFGMRRKEMEKHITGIEDFCELGRFLKMPVRSYSDGMRVRLGVAVVTCIHPEILVLDESIGAGDAHFLQKTTERVQKLYDRASIIVMASHAPALLKKLCNKAIWLDKGDVMMTGPVEEVQAAYIKATV